MSTYKKRAIPENVRRSVALREGGIPGETTEAHCHYCGAQGAIVWQALYGGRPGAWVYFRDLQLDHITPEIHGGPTDDPDNFVLACQWCNCSKGHRFSEPLHEPFSDRLREPLTHNSLPRAQARVARGTRRVGDRRQEEVLLVAELDHHRYRSSARAASR